MLRARPRFLARGGGWSIALGRITMSHIVGHNLDDPYLRLRTPAPTPSDEICSCPDKPPIKLMTALTENPIHCMRCNLEVAPEAVPLPEDMVDDVAGWTLVHDALDRLWLDSGEYESWALGELANPASPTNIRGLALRARLDRIRRCYFMLGHNESANACPTCERPLLPFEGGYPQQLVCEPCGLVLWLSNEKLAY